MQLVHKRIFLFIILATCSINPSKAGQYSDDLAKCLVRSVSPSDKIILSQWMFAMMSLNPAVRQFSKVTSTQRTKLNRRYAEMLKNLLTNSCLKETRKAVQYEGPAILAPSFNVLSQIGSQELIVNPEVASGALQLKGMLDVESLQRFLETAN